MTDQILMDAGYKEFAPSVFDGGGVEKKFQKRVKDEKGTKYFITVNKWRSWKHPYTGEVTPPAYEFKVCVTDARTFKPVLIDLYTGWELEEAEERIAAMFAHGLWAYYEEEKEANEETTDQE